MVCDVLKGSKNAKVKRYGFQQKTSFGLLGDFSGNEIRDMLRQAIDDGFLQQSEGQYPVVKLTAMGQDVLAGNRKVVQERMITPPQEDMMVPKKKRKQENPFIAEEALRTLFDALRAVRYDMAKKEHIPPFVIFSDATLWEMASQQPRTLEDMATIKGVGEFKLNKYGKQFIHAIANTIER